MNEQHRPDSSDVLVRMKNDLRAGIEWFVTCHRTMEDLLNHEGCTPAREGTEPLQASPQINLAHESPAVRLSALVSIAKDRRLSREWLEAIEQVALDDSDKRVRGLAILAILRFPIDIQQPALSRFAEEFAHLNVDEIIEILEILQETDHCLEQGRVSLRRISELINRVL